MIIGVILAICTGYCLLGGGKRIVKLAGLIVPFMGVSYVIISLIVILFHVRSVPAMFGQIFADAFDFKAIFGGVAGSCMVYGIKRGLYSNEAGVGSAPNASASAKVSHPAKQGLGKVAIDTLKDYESQKKTGKKPVFLGKNIGLKEEELEYRKED